MLDSEVDALFLDAFLLHFWIPVAPLYHINCVSFWMPPRSTSGRFSVLYLDPPLCLISMELVTKEILRTSSPTYFSSSLALVDLTPLPLRTFPDCVIPTSGC
jgi:hypothetical protein